MEELVEFILELLFGALDPVSNTKTWIKTTVVLAVGESMAVLFGIMSYSAYQRGNIEGCVATGIMTAVLGLGSLILVIYYHKRDWV